MLTVQSYVFHEHPRRDRNPVVKADISTMRPVGHDMNGSFCAWTKEHAPTKWTSSFPLEKQAKNIDPATASTLLKATTNSTYSGIVGGGSFSSTGGSTGSTSSFRKSMANPMLLKAAGEEPGQNAKSGPLSWKEKMGKPGSKVF
ncbi:unnamed protein product [Amoebophrya sp. A25]|nr:unnamed protein product [Amoebophrya sp. A25]|eukprot:GSA25T00009714001.1